MSDSSPVPPHALKPTIIQRRKSSVGQIQLGDTAVPSMSQVAQLPRSANRKNSMSKIRAKYAKSYENKMWIFPFAIMLATLAAYYLTGPGEQNVLHMFMFCSYRQEPAPGSTDPVVYGKGGKDFAFIAFYIVFFTFFREFCMHVLLRPVALYFGLKKGKVARFMEQSYAVIYYAIAGPFGIYVMYNTPIWFFQTTPFYVDYPHKTHILMFKLFYLLQAAFWSQQSIVLILQLEKPRKDFKELVFHHVVTIALIWCSYRFHFTWMGLVVYITMDVSDFFLAASKTLNYLDSPFAPPMLFVFTPVWIYLRHYINLKILWSILTEFKTVGEWDLNWETQQYKCWISQYITFSLLAGLQLVNIYWLFLILRIIYRYLALSERRDDRSEDEDEGEEEEAEKAKNE